MPLRGVAMNTAPLSLSSDAGSPCRWTVLWKVSTTSWALTVVGLRSTAEGFLLVDSVAELARPNGSALPRATVVRVRPKACTFPAR